jgi:glutamyl-tRNA reductase
MAITVVGISHRTAPLEVRERFAMAPEESAAALRHLVGEGCTEAVLLSTCNRTELYLRAPQESVNAPALGTRLLCSHSGMRETEAGAYLFTRHAERAVEHLFRVVASLDSMIVGEAQIQGQVRDAYGRAVELKGGPLTVGPVLSRLFETALRVGARVRTETRLGAGAASIPSAAVDLARKIFGTLDGRRAIVLGAGEMSALTLQCLNAAGVASAIVTSRSDARARELVAAHGGEAAPFDRMEELLGDADIVATATAAPHALITRALVERARAGRRSRPLLILDIALPRDVEPAVGELDDVFLYDLDDLSRVVEGTLEQRRSEVALAESIIAQGIEEFLGWYRGRDVVPVIRALRGRAETLRLRELERARRSLRDLSPAQLDAVDALTKQLLAKLLHDPTTRLREAAAEGRNGEVADLARYLFSLREDHDPGDE